MRVLFATCVLACVGVFAQDTEAETDTEEVQVTSTTTPAPSGKKKHPKKGGKSRTGDNCAASCATISECASSELNSWCLMDGTCVGLYVRPNRRVCYQAGSIDTCGNGEKSPLSCSALITTTTRMPDPCVGWCEDVTDCMNSPAGSFCQEDGFCYGLYDRVGQSRCYAFFGQGCGLANPLIPLSCGVYTTTTPDPCVTTTTVDPCVSTTTVDPCTTTTPCPPGAEKQQEILNWYYEQLAQLQKGGAAVPATVPTPLETAAQRWSQNLAPSFVRASPRAKLFDPCQAHCRGSPACSLTRGSGCEGGTCKNLFVNSLGKVCFRSHPRACPDSEFVQLTC